MCNRLAQLNATEHCLPGLRRAAVDVDGMQLQLRMCLRATGTTIYMAATMSTLLEIKAVVMYMLLVYAQRRWMPSNASSIDAPLWFCRPSPSSSHALKLMLEIDDSASAGE